MAYGNLPGGGFGGYIKAKQPLPLDERSYVPVKDEWPPKYGVYGEKEPETEKFGKEIGLDTEEKGKQRPSKSLLRKNEPTQDVDITPELERDKDIKLKQDKLPIKFEKSPPEQKKTRRVTFDDELFEDYPKITSKQKKEKFDNIELKNGKGVASGDIRKIAKDKKDISRKIREREFGKEDEQPDDSRIASRKKELDDIRETAKHKKDTSQKVREKELGREGKQPDDSKTVPKKGEADDTREARKDTSRKVRERELGKEDKQPDDSEITSRKKELDYSREIAKDKKDTSRKFKEKELGKEGKQPDDSKIVPEKEGDDIREVGKEDISRKVRERELGKEDEQPDDSRTTSRKEELDDIRETAKVKKDTSRKVREKKLGREGKQPGDSKIVPKKEEGEDIREVEKDTSRKVRERELGKEDKQFDDSKIKSKKKELDDIREIAKDKKIKTSRKFKEKELGKQDKQPGGSKIVSKEEEEEDIRDIAKDEKDTSRKVGEKELFKEGRQPSDSKIASRKKELDEEFAKRLIGDRKYPEEESKVSKEKTVGGQRKVRKGKTATDGELSEDDSEIAIKGEEAEEIKGVERKKLAKERAERKRETISKGYDSKALKRKKVEPRKIRPETEITHDKYPTDGMKQKESETKIQRYRRKFTSDDMVSTDDIVDKSVPLEKQDEVVFVPEENISEDHEETTFEDQKELRIKFRRIRKVPTYTYYKRKRSFLRFCPCLDRLLHSQRIECRALKAMLGFPIGALFGFALYWIVLDRMGAEDYYFWLLGTVLGIGFALSTQVRCICLLSIPACCGRAGRAFVNTFILAYVIEGPLTNILANSKEAMRSISCTASLNLNHSVERFKLMYKPVKEIVMDFVGAGNKVQGDSKKLEETFQDVEKEVRDEDEMRESAADIEEFDDEIGGESRVGIIKKKFKRKRKPEFGENSEKKYGMKSEFRCEAFMGKRSCDSNDVMNPGFGASVDTADGVQSEFDKDFTVQLQYKLIIPEESADQLVPEDISGAMKYSFERRKRNLDFFTQLVDRILALLCLLVINSSRKYCNHYLRIIQFDNKYVTSYFRHIDARRQKKGKIVLLPLKKGERLELSEPFSVRFSPEEKMLLIVSGLKMVSEILTVTILLMFDRIFFELLDIIKRHAHVTYKQTGVHHIKMTIYGDGFVGNMVRGILKGFDKKHSADQVTTTEECLPLPTKLPRERIIRVYTIFLLMLLLIILESYALRLRRVICAFFYPKREKRRIIFLYNDRLKKRRSFLQHMRHRVRKQAREQAISMDSGVFFSLRLFYPKYFGWISKIGLGLAQCLICNETESKSRLIGCTGCPFSYCTECWQDTEGKCFVCLPDYDTEPSEDSASED